MVDDREENLISLEHLLDDDDLDLVSVPSGQEALAKTLDMDFFLILMDVEMPEMNGYETAELLRGNSKTRDIPIIFITANNRDEEQMFKGYDAGAVDYLIKPIAAPILLGKISVFKTLFTQQQELVQKTEELNGIISEMEELHQELEEKNNQLKILSRQDGLTGLYNRRYFDELLDEEWIRGFRTGHKLSLIMGDVDEFKLYNDTYGHVAGDECLIAVGRVFSTVLQRRIDRVARYGGEEFVAILPETDEEGAEAVARELIDALRSAKIEHTSSTRGTRLTMSLGICTMVPQRDVRAMDFLNKADQGLYKAKEMGRDCFIVEKWVDPS